MSDPQRYHYYGTPDPMTEKETYHCKKYLKRKAANLVTEGRFLIDTAALATLFHLDCFNCQRVHRETCCEGGQPYAADLWQIPIIEQEAPAVVQTYLQAAVQKRIKQCGIWEKGNSPGELLMNHGNCVFFAEINGTSCCSLHAFAEANQREVYPMKPFSCQLYPLDIIQIGENILITAVNTETAAFSRWGTDYLESFYCASIERRRKATHLEPELFSLDGYRPAYLWGLELLQHAFGKETAEAVKQALES